MIRWFNLLALIGFAIGTVLLSAQSSNLTPSAAVMQAAEAAFPEDLRYAGTAPSENAYYTCAAVLSQNLKGTPELIAAAYSGDGAKVGILANTPNGAEVLSDITHQQILPTSGPCDLNIADLADPEYPNSPLEKTIDVTFSNGPDWFFTWDGKELHNITPLQAEMSGWHGKFVPDSSMYSAMIVDIDHSGAMQIVADEVAPDRGPWPDDGISSSGIRRIYRYNGTTYEPAQTALFIAGYGPNLPETPDQKAKYAYGTPPWAFHIAMHQTPAPNYKLLVVNGDRGGSNRVSSAEVEINGVTVIQPAEINQSVETLTRTVQLQKENKIKVTVDGPDKSHMCVTVE